MKRETLKTPHEQINAAIAHLEHIAQLHHTRWRAPVIPFPYAATKAGRAAQ